MIGEQTKILLVEDNPGDARLLREFLKDARSVQVDLAHVGRLDDALKRLGEEHFQVILLDLSLPDAQGLVTLTRVHERAPDTPIVVLTGLDDEELAVRAVREGAQDYLVKGQVDASLLVRSMRYAVERKNVQEQIQRHLQHITALREIDHAITSSLDLRTVLDVLLEKIDIALPYAAATVRLVNKKSGLLAPVACRNLDEKEWKADRWNGGRGPANVVFEKKAPIMVLNIQKDARILDPDFFLKHGLHSFLGIPLTIKEEILGVISFYTKEEHEFSQGEVDFLTSLASQAAIAIHNSQLYEEARSRESQLEETNRMLSALHEVAAAASESLDLDRVFKAAIRKITDVFRFDATRIHVYSERRDELVLRASFATDPDQFAAAQSFARGEGIVGKVAESGEPLIFEDVQTDPVFQQFSRTRILNRFGYHFFAVFPIKGKLTNLGTLGCVGTAPRKLSLGEMQLLEAMADQIAVAMENSELYEQLRQKVSELQQKTAALERANKVKDEFLSVMSHELRTPLNVVVGYAEMMKDGLLGEVSEEQKSALQKMMKRAKDQLALIQDILQATHMEADGLKMERDEVNLTEFLDDLRSSYQVSLDKKIDLLWNYPDSLPAIMTDGGKLRQILQNLINNAIKFTEKGHVSVSATIRPQATAGVQGESPYVEFRVADTGVGIPLEDLPYIFQKFRQVDSSETRSYGGVGLGLYIVKKFTELLGGEVGVESAPGKGSVFTVHIPATNGQRGNATDVHDG